MLLIDVFNNYSLLVYFKFYNIGLMIACFYRHSLNRRARLSSGTRGLKFGMSLHQPNFLCASREDWREYTFVQPHLSLYCSHMRKATKSHSFVFSFQTLNPFFASGDFCHLLIAFANSLNPDQDRHFVGPDLDPNHLTL